MSKKKISLTLSTKTKNALNKLKKKTNSKKKSASSIVGDSNFGSIALTKIFNGDLEDWTKYDASQKHIVPWAKFLFKYANKKTICIPSKEYIEKNKQNIFMNPYDIPARKSKVFIQKKCLPKTFSLKLFDEERNTNNNEDLVETAVWKNAKGDYSNISQTGYKKVLLKHSEDEKVYFIPAFAGRKGKFFKTDILEQELIRCDKMSPKITTSLHLLTIFFSEDRVHQNVLIFNHKNRTLSRFEPHGVTKKQSLNVVDDLLRKFVVKMNTKLKGIKFISMNDMCALPGPQTRELQQTIFKKTHKILGKEVKLGAGGFCAVFSLMFIHYVLEFSSLSPKEIISQMLSSPNEIAEEVRKYAHQIVKYIEKLNI